MLETLLLTADYVVSRLWGRTDAHSFRWACLFNQICTGAETEMITEGGEVGFVKRMVEESLGLKHRIR